MYDISFDPINHIYKVDGVEKTSVTTALGLIQDFSKIPAHHLEKARIRGGRVHSITELYDLDDLGDYEPELEPYLQGWVNFIADTGWTSALIEEPVYSEKYDYVGTLDRVGSFPGDEADTVLDIKAVAAMSPITGLQIAAYRQALIETHGDDLFGRVAVQLGPNHPRGYKLHKFENDNDFKYFVTVLNAYNIGRMLNG